MSVGRFQQVMNELSKKIQFSTENLYQHIIAIRGGIASTKVSIVVINNNGFDMTIDEVKQYIKDNASYTQASIVGNNGYVPCTGYAGASTADMQTAIGIAYATDTGKFIVVRHKDATSVSYYECSDISLLNNYQKTTLIALNNVNKPSYKTISTKLSLGGTAESSANVNWTCYKYPLGDGKFKYEWVGNYSQTKNVAVTSAYGSGYMSPKFQITLPDSNMAGKCIIYAGQNGSTCWVAPSIGGSSLDFYLIRNTSNTINNTVEINISCSYILNS